MAWYVNLNGQTMGPVDDAQVVAWIHSGSLLTGSVCAVGSQQWIDLAAYPAFAAALRSAAPPPPHPGPTTRAAAAPSGAHSPAAANARRATPNPVAHAMGTGLRKFGRWLLLGFLVLLLIGISVSGGFGILLGAALTGWGVFGYKRSRRTAVEFVVGRTEPARWASAFTVAVGALMILFGIGGIFAQRAAASHKEEAAEAAKKQAIEAGIRRKQMQTNLFAQAPQKATEWRGALKKLSDDLASVKANDDLHTKLGEFAALRDRAKNWLGQLDLKPADAAAAESEIESKLSQVQTMTNFVDAVSSFEGAFQNAKALIAKHSWLDADQALDEALQRAATLQIADPSLRALVGGGFDPDRRKAEVAATKAGIAGAVAGARRQQAAVDAAEKKRAAAEEVAKAAAQAYLNLCGEAPVVSGWDGEMIGLASTIKETANDPDSIDVDKCTPPVLTKDNCWRSSCNVRGKNGFGALVLQRQTWTYSKVLGFRPAN